MKSVLNEFLNNNCSFSKPSFIMISFLILLLTIFIEGKIQLEHSETGHSNLNPTQSGIFRPSQSFLKHHHIKFYHHKQNLLHDDSNNEIRVRSARQSTEIEPHDQTYRTKPGRLQSGIGNLKLPTTEPANNESSSMESPKHRSGSTHTKDMEDFFSPQIPLPAEEHFLLIDTSSNDSQNCSNSTDMCGLEHAPVFEQSTMVKAIILLVIAGLSLVGNIATLWSIIRTGRQSTSTVYILLVQLAIADLLVALFCLMADAIWKITVQWYAGDALCKFVKFMQMFALYLSTYVLVLIGFDRLCAIRFPMARIKAKYYVRNGIVCIWSLSALFSSPQVRALNLLYFVHWSVNWRSEWRTC